MPFRNGAASWPSMDTLECTRAAAAIVAVGPSTGAEIGRRADQGGIAKTLEGAKPKGGSSLGGGQPPPAGRRAPARAKAQRSAAEEICGACSTGDRGANDVWVRFDREVELPRERGNLRRANPMSAARLQHDGQGLEGRKPPRGKSNPEGGRWREGKARVNRTFEP